MQKLFLDWGIPFSAAMDCIKPYLITTFARHTIFQFRLREKVLSDNDTILNKYLMLINYLIGDEALGTNTEG